jgi:hypothetical protein
MEQEQIDEINAACLELAAATGKRVTPSGFIRLACVMAASAAPASAARLAGGAR